MPAYASPTPKTTGDVAGTLRLLALLALSIVLIVLDHRGGWLSQFRTQANIAVQPLWWVAGLPARLGDSVRNDAASRSTLSDDNHRLRNALLVANARQARLQVAAAENERLRGLLGAARRGHLDVQLAPILDIDLDPTRQRLILGAGTRNGVLVGQSVIDAGGLVGQIIQATPITSTVLLLTDPDHAVPVTVARSGVRLIAYGKGRSDELDLANIPLSSDVKVGDAIVTSGIGGRFPPGFPVGTVASLRPDDSRAFLVGELKPAAQLNRGRDVLLLRDVVIAPAAASAAKNTGDGTALSDPVAAAAFTKVALPDATALPADADAPAAVSTSHPASDAAPIPAMPSATSRAIAPNTAVTRADAAVNASQRTDVAPTNPPRTPAPDAKPAVPSVPPATQGARR